MNHALLAPSSSDRWTICHPCARLEAKLPEKPSSYAEEGTIAHKLADIRASKALKNKKPLLSTLKYIKDSDFYNKEMEDHISDFIRFVKSLMTKVSIIFFESKLHLNAWIPESFGTGDIGLINGKKLYVIDLKYGQGVEVSAIDNTQLKIYALGWLEKLFLFDIRQIELIIYQPRIGNISRFSISVDDLLEWAETVLKPAAKKAWSGKGVFVPGTHCQFCRVKPQCKAYSNFNLGLDKYAFEHPNLLKLKDISLILDQASAFKNWIKSVEDYAEEQAIKGKVVPGYKIVEGRSNRVIGNKKEFIAALKKAGLKETQFLKTDIISLTDLKKQLGVKVFDKYITQHLIKPPGSLTLVPLEDKRAAFNSESKAKQDFADIIKTK